MKRALVTLESISPYSQSRYYQTPKKEKEGPADYEERTWRDRVHTDRDGNIQIPPMSFKNCLAEAAKFLSVQIPGKGKATYTKHFEAGVLVNTPLTLPIRKEDGSRRTQVHLPEMINRAFPDAQFLICWRFTLDCACMSGIALNTQAAMMTPSRFIPLLPC